MFAPQWFLLSHPQPTRTDDLRGPLPHTFGLVIFLVNVVNDVVKKVTRKSTWDMPEVLKVASPTGPSTLAVLSNVFSKVGSFVKGNSQPAVLV